MRDIIDTARVQGHLHVHNGRSGSSVANQIQYGWGAVAAKLMGAGDQAYKISTMYIEFENVASPGDPVTLPTYTRSEGQEYYENLSLATDRDFLRVSLLLPAAVSVEDGYEDYIPANEGNLLTFYTQSQGAVGYHGRTFSHSVNSKVFGAALVATPTADDPTQDIIVARTYLLAASQVLKIASSQIGLTWRLSLL